MHEPIIEVKNISKSYKIRHEGSSYLTLRDIIADNLSHPFRWMKNKAKKILGRDSQETFWALKDVNFEVNRGETIGIIGANGAGKSTLLKIMSQITPPTDGEIVIRGKVGSLLEVGTGFHPELTGRENISLNGAILGMHKKEIEDKFDRIVAFSGIEKFLDTPVKFYSSGMYVRLAFSVAVHMDPDILIVDEILAVGDSEFQKKCLDKMKELTADEGRTILFVSHNLVAVQNLCKRSILLKGGQVRMIGDTKDVIDFYLEDKIKPSSVPTNNVAGRDIIQDIHFTDIAVTTTEDATTIKSSDKLRFKLRYSSGFIQGISDARIIITVFSERSDQSVLRLDSAVTADSFNPHVPGEGEIICETDTINLFEGKYYIDVYFLIQETSQDYIKRASEFEVKTDLAHYHYRKDPESKITDCVIKYAFIQNK